MNGNIKTNVPFKTDLDTASMRGWDSQGNFVGDQAPDVQKSANVVTALVPGVDYDRDSSSMRMSDRARIALGFDL